MTRTFLIILVLFSFMNCKRRPSSTDSGRQSTYTTTKSTRDGSTTRENTRSRPDSKSKANIVKMSLNGGVYTVPIEINDQPMDIIFDTGASIISISETEVYFLIKQGKITEDDFIGTAKFQDATGGISEGTLINLKKVKIGNKVIYDVEASVVHNLDAPLLDRKSVV